MSKERRVLVVHLALTNDAVSVSQRERKEIERISPCNPISHANLASGFRKSRGRT